MNQISSLKFQAAQLDQSKPTRAISFGPMTTKVVLLVFFAVLLLLYLAQSTQGATRQYEIRGLEDNLSTMKQDQETLELESVRLQSLSTVMPAAPIPAAPVNGQKAPAVVPAPDTLIPAQQIVAIPTASH